MQVWRINSSSSSSASSSTAPAFNSISACPWTEDAIQPRMHRCHSVWKEPRVRTVSRHIGEAGATLFFERLYDRSGDGKHCRKTAWGCIVLAYSVIAWGSFVRDARTVASPCRRQRWDATYRPTSALFAGLQYFLDFLVCQSHKPKESNVQLCSISEQNFSEHSFVV